MRDNDSIILEEKYSQIYNEGIGSRFAARAGTNFKSLAGKALGAVGRGMGGQSGQTLQNVQTQATSEVQSARYDKLQQIYNKEAESLVNDLVSTLEQTVDEM
jgi:hypothetical protein